MSKPRGQCWFKECTAKIESTYKVRLGCSSSYIEYEGRYCCFHFECAWPDVERAIKVHKAARAESRQEAKES